MLPLLFACAPSPARPTDLPVPRDGTPDSAITAGPWTFTTTAGRGALHGPREIDLGEGVLAHVAFSPARDRMAYARSTTEPVPNLYLVTLDSGAITRLTDWEGAEDRPVFSPDGRRLAFFSGRSGIASLYVAALADAADGIQPEEARQLTNAGLVSRGGGPPEGLVPPPDDGVVRWDEGGIRWIGGGAPVVVVP